MPCSTTVWWSCALFYYCKVGMCLVQLLYGDCVPCSTTVRWPCALFYNCMVAVYLVLLLYGG